MLFPLAVHKEKNSCYGVTVPDLKGCFSAGDTLDEAIANASKAIKGHLNLLMEEGVTIKQPKSIAEHKSESQYKTAIWAWVRVGFANRSPYRRFNAD